MRLPNRTATNTIRIGVWLWQGVWVAANCANAQEPALPQSTLEANAAQPHPVRLSPPTPGIVSLGRPQGIEEPSDAPPAIPPKSAPDVQETVVRIKTAPPSAEEIFRLETETEFRSRLVQEIGRGKDRLQIPEFEVPKTVPMLSHRNWPERTEFVEPSRLCFGRLYFEQNASERHGRSLGFIQSFVAAGTFYADVACLPVSLFTTPLLQCDEHRDLTGSPRYSTSGMIWSK